MRQRRPARDRDEWEVAGPAGVTSPAQRGVARLWPLPPPAPPPNQPSGQSLMALEHPKPRPQGVATALGNIRPPSPLQEEQRWCGNSTGHRLIWSIYTGII